MARLKCPKCRRDISNQARTCPNCACPLSGNWNHTGIRKAVYKAIDTVDEYLYYIIAGLMICVVIFLVYRHFYYKNPFEPLQADMTRKEVQEELGKPNVQIHADDKDDSGERFNYDSDKYQYTTILGLLGEMDIDYSERGSEILSIVWRYEIPEHEKLKDYKDKISELRKWLDKETDSTGKNNRWKDEMGNQYELYIDRGSGSSFSPSYISIWYKPNNLLE